MSGRLTKEELVRAAVAVRQAMLDESTMPDDAHAALTAILDDADAVRAEEARLLDVVKKQEERIAALEGMLRRVAACRKSIESSNWGGEELLSDIDTLVPKAVSPVTTKALSAEELRHAITMGSIPALVAHIAALEADNAALLDAVKQSDHEDDCAFVSSFRMAQKAPSPAVSCNCRKAIEYAPHPGAALLERHEKASVRARNEGLQMAVSALLGHRNNALAAKRAMTTDIMRTKWDGVAEALDDMAEHLMSKMEPEQ